MLIADLFHEAAHSLLSEPDLKDSEGNFITVTSFGRPNMRQTSYDAIYNAGGCPDVSPVSH